MRLEQRILIVDDDDPIRVLLMTVLRRRGFVADCARNGIEAVELLGAGLYSLVVLDLMMPRMNGHELLDHIGAMPPATRPLVLVVTAGLGLRSLDTRFVVGTIQKPFDIELLVDTVGGCLAAATQQSQHESPRAESSAAQARPPESN